jgi:dolichyl-diphosphooligosaccharide--protein glycosyltransferase
MDDQGSAVLRRSLMYRLSYANLGEMLGPQMLDRVRRHAVSKQSARQPLKHFREVFSTENYLVRIYQVV